MKRALALIAALAMIGGAFLIRIDRGSETVAVAVGDDGESTPTQPVDTSLAIHCIEEARKACNEAGIRSTIDFAETYDALTTEAEPSVDVWVVVEPWPAIIDAERVANGLEPIAGSSVVVGSTNFRSFGWGQLAAASPCSEGEQITMACLMSGDAIGRKVGIRDPQRSATGALALAELAAQLDAGPSASELRNLGLSAPGGSYMSPLDEMALVGQGAFTLTIDLASESEGFLAGTRIESDIADVLALTPSVPVVIRVVAVGDDAGDDDLTDLAATLQPALEGFGWENGAGVGGPDATMVTNFRTLWEQIAR